MRPARLFIDGVHQDAADGRTAEVVDPARGTVLTTTAMAGRADVDLAATAARRAFGGPWSGFSGRDRGRHLRKLAMLLQRDADLFAALEALNCGKPFALARTDDVASAVEALEAGAASAERLEGRAIRVRGGKTVFTAREPAGVVLALLPWNYPLSLLAWKLAPALAAGNTVVAKVSALAPLTADRLGSLLEECGFPPGVVNLLPGDADAGRAAVVHPEIDRVTITGSEASGRDVAMRAGERLKPVAAELGGKSAQIVFADSGDVKATAQRLTEGYTAHAGQACTAGGRILVERPLYDRLLPRLVEAANQKRAGCPFDRRTDFAPMMTAARRDALHARITEATKHGARVVAGGDVLEPPDLAGFFYRATILVDVDPDSDLAQEELFGPVAVLLPFADEDEALRLAARTRFGLAASIRTADSARALRLARRLPVGTVWIDSHDEFDPSVPFAGRKASGFGTDLGAEALDFYTQIKATWVPDEAR